MQIAIIYHSHHGSTAKVAQTIANKLSTQQVSLVNLKTTKTIDLFKYDLIVLGGSFHAGKLGGKLKRFMKTNPVALLNKPLALFVLGANPKEIHQQIEKELPELLRNHAVALQWVGSEYLIEQMNFFERWIVKKITGVTHTVSNLDWAAVDQLVASVEKIPNPIQ